MNGFILLTGRRAFLFCTHGRESLKEKKFVGKKKIRQPDIVGKVTIDKVMIFLI